MSTLKKFIKRKDVSVPGFQYGGRPGYYWNGKEFKKSTGSTDSGGSFSQYGGIIMKDGGNAPIIVNDSNDPRLRAYNDSMHVYRLGQQAEIDYKAGLVNSDQEGSWKAYDIAVKKLGDTGGGGIGGAEYYKPKQLVSYQPQPIDKMPIRQQQLPTNQQQPDIKPVQGISRDDMWGKPNYRTGAPNNFSPDEYHRALGYPNIDNNGQPIKQYAEGGQAPLNWNNFNDFHSYVYQNNPNYGTDKLNHGNFANDSLMAFNKQYPDKAIHPNDIARYQQDAISNPNGVHMPYGQSAVEGIPGQKTTGYNRHEYEVRHIDAKGNLVSDNNYRTNVAGATKELAGMTPSISGANPWISNSRGVPMNAPQSQIDTLYQPQQTTATQPVQSIPQPMTQTTRRTTPAQLGANAYLPGENDYSVDSVRASEMKNGGTVDSDIPEYAKGGIHIKKSHIGKFTAYKQRTGKTTEEAMRSKDPHVRAMAVFASNAAKWHHQYGGPVKKMTTGGVDVDGSIADDAASDRPMYSVPQRASNMLQDSPSIQPQPNDSTGMFSPDNGQAPLNQLRVGQPSMNNPAFNNANTQRDAQANDWQHDSGEEPGSFSRTSHPSWTNQVEQWGNVHHAVLGVAMTAGTAYNNWNKQKDSAKAAIGNGLSSNIFAGTKTDNIGSKGDYVPNSGVFRPSESVPTRPGIFYPGDRGAGTNIGNYGPRDQRPIMKWGGQNKESLSLNTQWNTGQNWGQPGINPVPNPYSTPSRTLQEAEPGTENARLEKKEQVLGDFSGTGQPALMGVNSGTHESGNDIGLALPPESFVFSDTKSLRIKDPEILKLFGATKASTPAALAKQYNLQKYTSIVSDPKADQTSKKTAELMVSNYQNKLSQLAALQEQIKQNRGITPPAQQQEQVPMSAYGGSIPRMTGGGEYDEKQATEQGYQGQYGKTVKGLQRYQMETDKAQGANRFMDTYGTYGKKGYIDGINGPVTKRWQPPVASIDPVPVTTFNTTLPIPNPTNLNVSAPVSGIGALGDTGNNASVQSRGYRAGYTMPDKLGMLNSAYNLASIKKYLPWEAPVSAVTPDVVFMDPTRAIAANSELANQAQNASAMSGNGRAARANASAIQGQAATSAADIVGKYNNENVGIANNAARENSNITNQLLQTQGARATRLFDKTTIANQQYDNATREGRSGLLNQYSNAWNNRSKFDTMNSTNRFFNVDPNTGLQYFKSADAKAAFDSEMKRANGAGYSPGGAEKVNSIYQELIKQPAYQSEHGNKMALQLAQRMAGYGEHETVDYDQAGNKKKVSEKGVYSGPQQKYGGRTSALKSFAKKKERV